MTAQPLWLLKLLLLILSATALNANALSPRRIYLDTAPATSATTIVDIPEREPSFKAIEIRGLLPNKTRPTTTDSYSVVFAAIDTANYFMATLQPIGGNDDIRNDRAARLTVSRHCGDSIETLLTKQLTANIDPDRFDNSLAAEIDCATGHVAILAGHTNPAEVASTTLAKSEISGRVGFASTGRAQVDLAVVEYTPSATPQSEPLLTTEQIDSLIAASTESLVGIWQYLDRNTNAGYMRPGGNYTLAITGNAGSGFRITYLGGAEINSSHWQPGMLKGTLESTLYSGHYDLQWFDAEMQPVADECSATLESPTLLRLDFPLHRSSIRLTRLPH